MARIVSEVVTWLHCVFSKQVCVWMPCVGKTLTHHCYFTAHSQFMSRQNSAQPCTVLQLITFPWLCLYLLTGPHSWCALCTCFNASPHMVSNSKIERLLQAIFAILTCKDWLEVGKDGKYHQQRRSSIKTKWTGHAVSQAHKMRNSIDGLQHSTFTSSRSSSSSEVTVLLSVMNDRDCSII